MAVYTSAFDIGSGRSNLGRITDALAATLGRAVDAAEWTASPSQFQPTRLPAVFIKWIQTRTETRTFGTRDSSGRAVARGLMRVHSGTALIVMSATGNVAQEELVAKDAAEAALNAIDADRTLKTESESNADLCAGVQIVTVADWSETVEGTTYRGVSCDWEAMEI